MPEVTSKRKKTMTTTNDIFADGTVARIPSEPNPYNVYVRDSTSGWDDRVWWQAGSDVPVALPPGYELLFEADADA